MLCVFFMLGWEGGQLFVYVCGGSATLLPVKASGKDEFRARVEVSRKKKKKEKEKEKGEGRRKVGAVWGRDTPPRWLNEEEKDEEDEEEGVVMFFPTFLFFFSFFLNTNKRAQKQSS